MVAGKKYIKKKSWLGCHQRERPSLTPARDGAPGIKSPWKERKLLQGQFQSLQSTVEDILEYIWCLLPCLETQNQARTQESTCSFRHEIKGIDACSQRRCGNRLRAELESLSSIKMVSKWGRAGPSKIQPLGQIQ